MVTTIAKKKSDEKVFSSYQPFYKDSISLMLKAKKGLSPGAVFDFIQLSKLPNTMIEVAFNKSMKTFQNYLDKNMVLDAITSEKLLKLFSLYKKGAEVFGSVDAFSEWLTKPAFGLGSEIPQTMIDTNTGIDLIREELIRIEYGDLA